jgi:hypothetical protein
MKGEYNARSWRFTLADYASAAGVSIHTIRAAKQSGALKPWDTLSVARFVIGHRLTDIVKDDE